MEQQRWRWREVAGQRPGMGDAALVAALRCGDHGAVREFYLRFRPALLAAARRLGVDPADRPTVVDDCLADVAVHLMARDTPPPASLPAYLARSLRNRILNAARDRRLGVRRADAHAAECSLDGLGSSDAVDQSRAGDDEGPALSAPLERLAAALNATLTDEERLLVTWMSHCVPHRDIAAWLGIAYKAAAKRIERLRDRLQLAAVAYLDTVPEAERGELFVFLGRANLTRRGTERLEAIRQLPPEDGPA